MRFLTLILLVPFLSASAAVDSAENGALPQWSRETLRLVDRIAIQEDGRIKPMAAYARHTLLRFGGQLSCTTPDGRTLGASEWLLTALFFPDEARDIPVFRVENGDVLVTAGMQPRAKRGYYAYNDLAPVRKRIEDRAREYENVDERLLTTVQRQLTRLAGNLLEFESVLAVLDGLRGNRPFPDSPSGLPEFFASAELPHTLPHAPFALIPPEDPSVRSWCNPVEALRAVLRPEQAHEATWRLLQALARTWETRSDETGFQAAIAAFNSEVRRLAESRQDYGRLDAEALYLEWDPLRYALWFSVAGLVISGLSVVRRKHPERPCRRDWRRAASACAQVLTSGVAALLLCLSVAVRAFIRGRPPVSTLYETLLFSTLVAVLLCWLIASIYRNRSAVFLAALLGVIGLFLAVRYEAVEGKDTMPNLVAVLDTNFWLTSHVTTVVAGYGAGLLASALAHMYVCARLLGTQRLVRSSHHDITSLTYAILCLSLVLTLLGTVLGGVWASESWGRFWGWDPKENGALMIVLWQLAVLHAWRGGLIRELGLHLAAIIGGVIVVFSWFGINQLGVGLHTYGFTSGIDHALWWFYGVEWCVLMAAGLLALRANSRPGSHRDLPGEPRSFSGEASG